MKLNDPEGSKLERQKSWQWTKYSQREREMRRRRRRKSYILTYCRLDVEKLGQLWIFRSEGNLILSASAVLHRQY